MKITVCDICHKNGGGLVEASWRTTFKKGYEKLSVHLCTTHRYWQRGQGYESALNALMGLMEVKKDV